MSKERLFSRRMFLRAAALGTSALAAACAPRVVKETVVVEKVVKETVQVEVEKVVKEAVEVEKEVTRVVEKVVEVAPKSPEEILGPELMPGSPDHPRGWRTILPDLPPGVPHTPPIVITGSRRVDAGTKFLPGDSLDDNPWNRMIQKLFGVKFKVAWTWSTSDEANTKYNLALASGDMPDIMETVPLTIFVKMVEANVLLELGPIWDQYASERWKETFREFGDKPWVQCTINGKRWALPRTEQLAQNDTCLWVRQDWLNKLGLEPPKTLDELYEVGMAFVKAGIGAGPAGSTYGLLANVQFRNSWRGSLDPIWGGHHLTCNWSRFGWSKEGDRLRYDGIRPEAKDALALLRKWYADGMFRKDFFTIPTSEVHKDLAAGVCGMQFCPSWGADRDTLANFPEAEWAFYDVPTGPGGFKGKFTENPFAKGVFCCPKDFKHADKWIEVANWRLQKREDPWRRMHGWRGCDYDFDDKGNLIYPGIYYTPWTFGPFGTRGGGRSDPRADSRAIRYQLEEWAKIPPEKRDAMQEAVFKDPITVLSNRARLFLVERSPSDGLMDAFQGMPTPTMVERQVDLNKLEDQTFISIIIGEQPLDAFDAFVDNWKKLGGDRITEEVNEWYSKQ
ncbi:MAG: extracellular solute-binding protein [Chloroflexi bacterium]|nr:extracellular solute-binding protein [Chloroflexota bacterium]